MNGVSLGIGGQNNTHLGIYFPLELNSFYFQGLNFETFEFPVSIS